MNKKFFSNILVKPDGFHRLEPSSGSGALDVIRHLGFKNPFCYLLPNLIRSLFFRGCECGKWKPENGINVIEIMQSFLKDVKRIYIFGEPYLTGLGVHNVHMNQGDPIGSSFSKENGIWQDGGVIFEYEGSNSSLSILLTKFQTQSLNTDEQGRPR